MKAPYRIQKKGNIKIEETDRQDKVYPYIACK